MTSSTVIEHILLDVLIFSEGIGIALTISGNSDMSLTRLYFSKISKDFQDDFQGGTLEIGGLSEIVAFRDCV